MTAEEARGIIDRVLDMGSANKWETGFLESLSEKIDNGHEPTEREEEILEQIQSDRL